MNYILFDSNRNNFFPFSFTRPVCEIRVGILTIKEKWEKYLGKQTSCRTEEYLSKKFPFNANSKDENIWINGSVCPDENLCEEINSLETNEALFFENILIALNSGHDIHDDLRVD